MKVFIIMLFFALIETLHLTPKQMYSARGILMNPTITQTQRESIQKLLYTAHEKWAIKKAVEFKKFHHYKCRDISTNELVLSSKFGLLKSSRIYKGWSPFTKFSEIYVKSELLRTMTRRLSVTSCISMRDRMRNEVPVRNEVPMRNEVHNAVRNKNIQRPISSIKHNLKSDTPTPIENSAENNFYQNAWEYVDTLDAFTKRITWLKYDPEFKVKNSNKQIAELMCCSEETVRKAIIRFSDGMRQEVLYTYTSV